MGLGHSSVDSTGVDEQRACSLYNPPPPIAPTTLGRGDRAVPVNRCGSTRSTTASSIGYAALLPAASSATTRFAPSRLRNESTRELWDPAYISQSFIQDNVRLIPRMKQWVADNFGTKIGVTEYNWGGQPSTAPPPRPTSSASLAAKAPTCHPVIVPNVGSPTYNAFKMYRNYDGRSPRSVRERLRTATSPDICPSSPRACRQRAPVMVIQGRAGANVTVPVELRGRAGAALSTHRPGNAIRSGSVPWPPTPPLPYPRRASRFRGSGRRDPMADLSTEDGRAGHGARPADHARSWPPTRALHCGCDRDRRPASITGATDPPARAVGPAPRADPGTSARASTCLRRQRDHHRDG